MPVTLGSTAITTFLPFADFKRSAQCLDNQRLGQQRREVRAILSMITLGSNHPVALMWTGFEYQLLEYGLACCTEWQRRGFVDNLYEQLRDYQRRIDDTGTPPWMGDERLHANHRARLLAKDPRSYEQYGWAEQPVAENYWPVVKSRA